MAHNGRGLLKGACTNCAYSNNFDRYDKSSHTRQPRRLSTAGPAQILTSLRRPASSASGSSFGHFTSGTKFMKVPVPANLNQKTARGAADLRDIMRSHGDRLGLAAVQNKDVRSNSQFESTSGSRSWSGAGGAGSVSGDVEMTEAG